MKTLLVLLMSATMTSSISNTVVKDNGNKVIDNTSYNQVAEEVYRPQPRKEVQGYQYRINHGVLERRLWSYTRGIWLSNWEKA